MTGLWLALGFVVGAIGLLYLAARLVRPSESWDVARLLFPQFQDVPYAW